MARAVIIGGSGFIGRWLTRALEGRGYEVAVIDPAPPAEQAAWIELDARDPAAVADAVRPGDVVVHLFHSTVPAESMADPAAELGQNVIPYVTLLDRLAGRSPGLFVYSSTGGQIYGEIDGPIPETAECKPVSAYGAAKLAMERFTRLASELRGFPHLIVRIANPYGPYQELTNRHGVVPHLFRGILFHQPFIVYGGGSTVRDYIYIEDAAQAVARLIERGVKNRTVNIGTGAGTALAELIRLAERVSGGKAMIEDAPIRACDVGRNVLDVSLLHDLTGFAPAVGLEEGLRRTWEYMKAHAKT
ncbi:MAG TPA: NAD-dependent epimerase/dehydratase family protein [bacterium]|nr:NAD-dependent epimerase/dehydratase family protein [bacterium]